MTTTAKKRTELQDKVGLLPRMTATATCEPWCRNHAVEDFASWDGFCRGREVTVGPVTAHLTTGGSDDQPRVIIESKEDPALSLALVSELVSELTHMVRSAQPLDPESLVPLQIALDAVNEVRGTSYTLEQVASDVWVDLKRATRADTFVLAKRLAEL